MECLNIHVYIHTMQSLSQKLYKYVKSLPLFHAINIKIIFCSLMRMYVSYMIIKLLSTVCNSEILLSNINCNEKEDDKGRYFTIIP